MDVVLIRHGEPEWSRDGFAVGNPPLTERGHHQAAAMADHLRHEHFDEFTIQKPVWFRKLWCHTGRRVPQRPLCI